MRIKLPDGTVLIAPDDSDPSVAAKGYMRKQRIAAYRANNPAEYDNESPEYRQKYGALNGMSGTQKFLAGTGKSIVDTGRGIRQVSANVADSFDPTKNLSGLVTGIDNSRSGRARALIDEANKLDSELMSSGAGLAGNIAGQIGQLAMPAGAAGIAAKGARLLATKAPQLVGTASKLTRVANATNQLVKPTSLKSAIGTGAAFAATQPVGEGGSRLLNAGLGAAGNALGYGVAGLLGRIAKPVQSANTAARHRAADTLRSHGVPLDAQQLSNSSRLTSLKRMLGDNPLTSGGQVKQAENQAIAFDRAALKTIGEDADVATPDVINRAANRIGKVMDGVADRTQIKFDNKLLNDVTAVHSGLREMESGPASVINNQIEEILRLERGGNISSAAYKSIRDALGRIGSSQDSGVKHYAGQLKSALDDALSRSASESDVAALKTARLQWRNMEGVSKVIGATEGQHISPSRLANSLNTKPFGGKLGMVRGRGTTDLMRLAKSGATLIPDRFPQSGTAPRAALQLLAPGILGAGYGYAKDGDLSGAMAYGLGGAALPLALQRLINNPAAARYLINGVPRIGGKTGKAVGGIFGPAIRLSPAALLESSQQ